MFFHFMKNVLALKQKESQLGIFDSSMLILLLIFIPLAESTTCCNKKEIVGDSPESGVYWLVSSNETRCEDGCSYSKDNITNIFYCFSDVTYVAGGAGVEYVLPPGFDGTVHVVDCSSVVRTADDYWAIQQIIIPETITQGGTWGPRQFCASGSFATGFVLRYAPLCASRCNFDDDTALMGIWLNCGPYNDTSIESGVISSSVLPDYRRIGGGSSKGFVSTARLNCPANSFITQSQFLSEYYAGEDTSGGISCPPGIICTSFSSTFDPIGGKSGRFSSYRRGNSGHFLSYRLEEVIQDTFCPIEEVIQDTVCPLEEAIQNTSCPIE
ncbi:uncharacterized protein LOC111701587 [Eurytemora carolleeae]|uniref:uncharacterized protein LOC111701587 n=1 Tax=Eurytemora carolleeae TaxID=1294199 RepID=UPI000C78BA76|nr:uncharacterized protein LOC111701587 [Eurytemora carolleeae]|eukprot:XP_023328702.1 uncharacterized protein LOC111701587 [Eurytemora affinis]